MGGNGSGRKTNQERTQDMYYIAYDNETKPELVYLPYGNGCSRSRSCFNCILPDCTCDKRELTQNRVAKPMFSDIIVL
jgi:hypothetical protein